MSTEQSEGCKTHRSPTVESQDDAQTLWATDWSNLQRRRQEGVDEIPECVIQQRRIIKVSVDRGVSRSEASRLLRYDDDCEVPEEAVR